MGGLDPLATLSTHVGGVIFIDGSMIRATGDILLNPDGRDGIPTIAFQSREGWASALLLMPDALCRVLGERSGLVLAPMRDLVLRLPLDTDPELAE